MEVLDRAFTMIKSNDSNDDLDSIYKTLKLNTDKNVEMYSKLNELKNEIDNLEHKIANERTLILQSMEEASIAKRDIEVSERLRKKEKDVVDRIKYQ